MSTSPEFLAAELEAGRFGPSMVQNEDALRVKAAAELRRLAAVEAERDQLRAEVEALRADSFESVIQGLTATLPDDGSSITIYVEHWAGSVTATDWDGNEMPEHEAETVLDRVRYAAKWLDEQQSKLKQGGTESQG